MIKASKGPDLDIFLIKAAKGGLVMINFFSYFITCSNMSDITDVIGQYIH